MSDAASEVGGNIGAAFQTGPNRAARRRLAAGTKRPGKACACCQPVASDRAIDILGFRIGGGIKP